jgi:hypothetical protein
MAILIIIIVGTDNSLICLVFVIIMIVGFDNHQV